MGFETILKHLTWPLRAFVGLEVNIYYSEQKFGASLSEEKVLFTLFKNKILRTGLEPRGRK